MILNFKKLVASCVLVVTSFNSVISANASYYHKVREELNHGQSIKAEKDMYEQIFDMLEEGVKKYTSEDCEESFKNSDFGKIISFYISAKKGMSEKLVSSYKEKYTNLINSITDKKSAFDVLVQLQNEFNMVYETLVSQNEFFPCMLLSVEGNEEISEKDLDIRSFFKKTSIVDFSENEILEKEQQFNKLISNNNLDKLKSLLNKNVSELIDNMNSYKNIGSFNPEIMDLLIRSIGPDFLRVIYEKYLNDNSSLKDDMTKVDDIYNQVRNLYINRIKNCDWISSEKKELAINTLEQKIKFNISETKDLEENWRSKIPDNCKLENINFRQDDIINNMIICKDTKKKLLTNEELPTDYKNVLLKIYQHSIYMDPYVLPFDSFSVLVTRGSGLMERNKNKYKIFFPVPESQQMRKISKIYQELKGENNYDAFELLTARIIAHEMGHVLDHLIGTLKDADDLKISGFDEAKPTEQPDVPLTSEQEYIQQIKDRLKDNLEKKFNLKLETADEAFADLCADEIMMDYADLKNIDKKELFFILGNREINEVTVEKYDHLHPTSEARVDGIFPNLDEFESLISEEDRAKLYIKPTERIHIFRK